MHGRTVYYLFDASREEMSSKKHHVKELRDELVSIRGSARKPFSSCIIRYTAHLELNQRFDIH